MHGQVAVNDLKGGVGHMIRLGRHEYMAEFQLRIIPAILMLLLAAPAAAAEPELSPEALQRTIECRGDLATLSAFGEALFSSKQRPAWLKPLSDNGHPGMLGLWTYRLARPIKVFGRDVDTVSFLSQWVVVELPRDTADAIIRDQKMECAPIRIAEQYYHFIDDAEGPMLGAFTPTDNALELLLGGDAKPDAANRTLFVGCNYTPASKAEFLAVAAQAEAIVGGSAKALDETLKKPQ